MVGVYLLILDAEKSRLLGVIMSIGASAIGAAILAAFVERSNYIINKKERIMRYNNSVVNIYNQLWLIFANRSYKYLNKIESGADVFAQQAANRFVTQYKTSIIAIDNMLLDFYDMMGDCNIEFYQTLQQQLVHFISSLENPTSTENLIILLDGTKGWLRGNFDKEKLKKSLFIYYPEINSDTHKK